VDAEELLVHNRSKGECAKRVHAGVIQTFRVLALTCMQRRSESSWPVRTGQLTLELESKVISQMPTFVISSQEEDGIGIPDLERP